MNNSVIRGIVIGVGNMGKVAVRCMIDHGIEIVGAVDTDERILGKDVAEYIGYPAIGVEISGNLDQVLGSSEADVAVVATETAVDDIYGILEKCIRKGVNVATTSEEAFYPWKTAEESALKLDRLAKEHGVTVYGSGIQDVFYLNLCQVLTGACNDVKRIDCYNFLPLDDMGAVVAEEMFLGKTKAEYEKSVEESGGSNPLAEDTLTTACAVAASMNLDVTDTYMQCKAITGSGPVYHRGTGRTIQAGKVIGVDSIAGVKTAQGVEVEIVFCYKVTERETETPLIEWRVTGDPDLRLVVDDIKGEVTTSATLVNRIPDVLASEPGFQTFMTMPKPHCTIGTMCK